LVAVELRETTVGLIDERQGTIDKVDGGGCKREKARARNENRRA
jgi:hypothetical protein